MICRTIKFSQLNLHRVQLKLAILIRIRSIFYIILFTQSYRCYLWIIQAFYFYIPNLFCHLIFLNGIIIPLPRKIHHQGFLGLLYYKNMSKLDLFNFKWIYHQIIISKKLNFLINQRQFICKQKMWLAYMAHYFYGEIYLCILVGSSSYFLLFYLFQNIFIHYLKYPYNRRLGF